MSLGDVYDTTTGQLLKGNLVAAARQLVLEYFRSKNVWTKVPRKECFDNTGKPPITVKWVDTNKGDDDAPNYRSRLVARDIKRKGEDSIFAPTPPLEALRAILSLTATREFWPKESWEGVSSESPHRIQISFIDISRACFNARTTDSDPVYVDLMKMVIAKRVCVVG